MVHYMCSLCFLLDPSTPTKSLTQVTCNSFRKRHHTFDDKLWLLLYVMLLWECKEPNFSFDTLTGPAAAPSQAPVPCELCILTVELWNVPYVQMWNIPYLLALLKLFLNIQDSSSWSVFQPDIIISASEGTLLNNAQMKSNLAWWRVIICSLFVRIFVVPPGEAPAYVESPAG